MNQDSPIPDGNGKPRKKSKYTPKDPSECPKLPPPGVILNDEHVMALLGISPNTLRERRKKGEIPFFKSGRTTKYHSELILKMMGL